jgi:hypothetical protein
LDLLRLVALVAASFVVFWLIWEFVDIDLTHDDGQLYFWALVLPIALAVDWLWKRMARRKPHTKK